MTNLYEDLIAGKETLSVVGLGYVGMPIAIAFAKNIKAIGFDLNKAKIKLYKAGIDPTKEVGDEAVKNSTLLFTDDENLLKKAKFHIVAVPTPVNLDKTPDLSPVVGASEILGRNLVKGSIVVFESTVYPGVTEEVCVPILERESGLKCGVDFKIGYSPERINPGDKVHRLDTIKKIVSGMDEETLDVIAKVYEIVVKAGVYRASSIKIAEAAKVVENSQRDINIAFMNELAMAFDRMNIDTNEVVDAMNTKWNALGFRPGLVGGHCIGVDPYYFIYEAEKLGYHSEIISAGRRLNDGMAQFVVEAIIKKLVLANKRVKSAKVAIMGITFKENCPDVRNSKVGDIISGLKEYGIEPIIVDPVADVDDTKKMYNIGLTNIADVKDVDCLVFAVAHDKFKNMELADIDKLYAKSNDNASKVLIDIKGMFNLKELTNLGYTIWRL